MSASTLAFTDGAVDPRARAARSDFALEHDERILDFDAAVVERGLNLRAIADVEHTLDRRAVGARANDVGVRAIADEQSERADDDRFARARLAGEHVESPRQRQRQRLDDRESS